MFLLTVLCSSVFGFYGKYVNKCLFMCSGKLRFIVLLSRVPPKFKFTLFQDSTYKHSSTYIITKIMVLHFGKLRFILVLSRVPPRLVFKKNYIISPLFYAEICL